MNYKVFKILGVKKTYVMSLDGHDQDVSFDMDKVPNDVKPEAGDFIQLASIDGSNKHHARIIKRGDVKTDFNVIGGSND